MPVLSVPPVRTSVYKLYEQRMTVDPSEALQLNAPYPANMT